MQTNSLDNYIKKLKKKWSQIPGGSQDRFHSTDLLKLSDKKLLDFWNKQNNLAKVVRSFWQNNYKFQFKNKDVFEIGSGLGFDGIHYLESGASWTFCDIIKENIEVVKRIIKIKKISGNYDFVYFNSTIDISLINKKYDFIFAIGSLINLPFSLARDETLIFLNLLKKNGRWIELTYPKERWIREGSDDFSTWGHKTDGDNTFWVEYYNLIKLRQRFYPYSIKPIMNINLENNSFNWFDLKVSKFKKSITTIQIDLPNKKNNISFLNFKSFLNVKNKKSFLWSEQEEILLNSYKSKSFLHVTLNISVRKGSIGIMLYNQSQNIYSHERIVDSSEFDIDVELFFEVHAGDIYLKIRNVFSGTIPKYIINSITISSIDEEKYYFLT